MQQLSPKYRVSVVPVQIGLEIPEARMGDAGRYECHLSNDVGKTTGECGVTVHKIFKPPFFSRRLSDVKQLRDCDARLVCEVGCNPKPEVKWFHNGKPVEDDGGRCGLKTFLSAAKPRPWNTRCCCCCSWGDY